MSFIGSHLDVVPADPAGWQRDPFVMEREGDMVYGRGTTDCLGHVAVLTDFFATLAERRYIC
jgi:acetylornithine deacetylase